jgi:hypothetical protein
MTHRRAALKAFLGGEDATGSPHGDRVTSEIAVVLELDLRGGSGSRKRSPVRSCAHPRPRAQEPRRPRRGGFLGGGRALRPPWGEPTRRCTVRVSPTRAEPGCIDRRTAIPHLRRSWHFREPLAIAGHGVEARYRLKDEYKQWATPRIVLLVDELGDVALGDDNIPALKASVELGMAHSRAVCDRQPRARGGGPCFDGKAVGTRRPRTHCLSSQRKTCSSPWSQPGSPSRAKRIHAEWMRAASWGGPPSEPRRPSSPRRPSA